MTEQGRLTLAREADHLWRAARQQHQERRERLTEQLLWPLKALVVGAAVTCVLTGWILVYCVTGEWMDPA